jgi:di/tricarboxylate transporter
MAPLQKRALYSLVIGLILAITLIGVFLAKGDVTTFDEDLGFRLIVYSLWIGVPVAYLIVMNLTPLRKLKQIDERDRLIMSRAPRIQLLAVIFSLVVWITVLTEAYWDQGQVPVVFLTLIFISTLVISTLAQSLGILIGYWRMR